MSIKFKKLVLCSALVLSGCAGVYPAPAKFSAREIDCAVLGNHMNKDQVWKNACVTDDVLFGQAKEQDEAIKKQDDICYQASKLTLQNSDKKTIDATNAKCESIKVSSAKVYASNLSMDALCFQWNTGANNKYFDSAIRAEVKAREVDCPALLLTSAQRQTATAEAMQAQAMQQQAEAQRAQANAALLEALKPPPPAPVYIPPPVYQAPTTTNCRFFGNTMRCNSY